MVTDKGVCMADQDQNEGTASVVPNIYA